MPAEAGRKVEGPGCCATSVGRPVGHVDLLAFGGWPMTSEAVLRGMRVPTLPSVLFTTGLAGHVAGDGATPAGWVLVALFVLTVVAVAPFVGATLSPARVVALLVGGQGVLHAALQLLGGTAVTATTTMYGEGQRWAGVVASSSHLMMHPDAAASHGSVMSLMSGGHLVMLLAHLGRGGRGRGVAGGWRARLWMLLALTARPLRRRVADDRGRSPRRRRRCRQLSTASDWLGLAPRGPWLDVDRGCHLAARPACVA